MFYYQSLLNKFDVYEISVDRNPRDYSDFLIQITKQEYDEIIRTNKIYPLARKGLVWILSN